MHFKNTLRHVTLSYNLSFFRGGGGALYSFGHCTLLIWPIIYIFMGNMNYQYTSFLAHYTYTSFFGPLYIYVLTVSGVLCQYELYMIFWPLIHYFLPISIVHLNDLHYCWPILLFNCFIYFFGGVEGIIHSLFNIIIYRFGQFQTFCGAIMNYTLFFGPLYIIFCQYTCVNCKFCIYTHLQ